MGTDISVSLRREKIHAVLLNYFLLNCHRHLCTESIPGVILGPPHIHGTPEKGLKGKT